jgi:hypothetical protein
MHEPTALGVANGERSCAFTYGWHVGGDLEGDVGIDLSVPMRQVMIETKLV